VLEANSFAYLFISTGIACPLILNNGVSASVALGAGEVGHMVLDPLGPKCHCGNRGCLESFSSDTAIIRACSEAIAAGGAPLLAGLCSGREPTMAQILKAQEQGEIAVERIVLRALYYIGVAIANIYNFIRPDVLLIEGELFANTKNRQVLLDTVFDHLYSTIKDANFIFVDPDINSGAAGASASAIRDFLTSVDS